MERKKKLSIYIYICRSQTIKNTKYRCKRQTRRKKVQHDTRERSQRLWGKRTSRETSQQTKGQSSGTPTERHARHPMPGADTLHPFPVPCLLPNRCSMSSYVIHTVTMCLTSLVIKKRKLNESLCCTISQTGDD